jgi:hypothetical protein
VRRLSPVLIVATLATATWAEPQALEAWKYETKDMCIVYLNEGQEYLLPHMARCFANSMGFYQKNLGFAPKEPVTILMQDFDDYGYAGASAMPRNYLTLGIEPFEYVYETSPTNERINWVMSHELLHIVASDKPAGGDVTARKLFLGKVGASGDQPLSMLYSYWTTPRMYAPRWYHEGAAVFMETWMAGGIGRALGGYDEMVFRTWVKEDTRFYDTVGLESEGKAIDFQVGQMSYLYGTRFISYLAYTYGPQKVLDWVIRKEGTKASYRAQFEQVFGTDLDSEWKKWIEWERSWQQENLKNVGTYPVTPFTTLSSRPLGSVSRMFWDDKRKTLFTAVNYPGEFAHIAAITPDGWQVRKITEIPTPALYYVASLAYDPESGTVFFTTRNSRQWRDINSVNVDTGEVKHLIKNARVGDLVFNRGDKSLWGIRHHNGLSILVRIAPPYDRWESIVEIMEMPYGKDLFDIDISPDGEYLTGSIIEVTGRQRLVRMKIADLVAGASPYETLHEFADNSPANFVYSPDGKYLFGTSYYTGVSNIFRYSFETKEMDAITNGETGFFRPIPVSDTRVGAFSYTSQGFVPVLLDAKKIEDINPIRFLGQAIVERHPIVKEWKLDSPASVDLDALHPVKSAFHPLKEIVLTSAYPIVESYRGTTAAGVRFNFMDPVGFAGLDLSASASFGESIPNDERIHLSAEFSYPPWEVFGHLNQADFYDFFGPTKNARKGYAAGVSYGSILINERPKKLEYTLRATRYGDLDTLPDNQNVSVDIRRYTALSGRLRYEAFRKSIGGLDPEKGLEWTLMASDQIVGSDHYPRAYGQLAFGIPLPWDHSSLWPQVSAGASQGDPDDPLANFYFGAFGNNWVDHGEVRRFRDPWAFPGLEIDELPGTDFGKAMLEWRLPPLRFKRFGLPSFYLTWASAVLFGGTITTNLDNEALRETVNNVGTQLDFKVVMFTNLSCTLSFGYAYAWGEGRPSSNEFMASLKIM